MKHKILIATGVGISGYSWPYIKSGLRFCVSQIPRQWANDWADDCVALLRTSLSGPNLILVCVASSLFIKVSEKHSAVMNVVERSIHGVTYYAAGAFGGALASSILSSVHPSVSPLINNLVFVAGFLACAIDIGGQASDFIAKPLNTACNLIDNAASTILSVPSALFSR